MTSVTLMTPIMALMSPMTPIMSPMTPLMTLIKKDKNLVFMKK